MKNQNLKFIRRKDVLAVLPLKATALYHRMQEGLFPKPVSLGARAVGWPEHEVQHVLSALLSGCDEVEIRKIVSSMESARATLSTSNLEGATE